MQRLCSQIYADCTLCATLAASGFSVSSRGGTSQAMLGWAGLGLQASSGKGFEVGGIGGGRREEGVEGPVS